MQKQYNNILMVDVPKDATNIRHYGGTAIFFDTDTERGVALDMIDVPKGYTLVNPLNLVSEEQAVKFMPITEHGYPHFGEVAKTNSAFIEMAKQEGSPFSFVGTFYTTALEALNSLATHLGFENANPIVLLKK